jgi:hypothetical protein
MFLVTKLINEGSTVCININKIIYFDAGNKKDTVDVWLENDMHMTIDKSFGDMCIELDKLNLISNNGEKIRQK